MSIRTHFEMNGIPRPDPDRMEAIRENILSFYDARAFQKQVMTISIWVAVTATLIFIVAHCHTPFAKKHGNSKK